MALAYAQYPGNGSTTVFGVNFPYLHKDHIQVKVNGNPVAFTWTSATVVQVSPAPAAGTIVDVRRVTPRDKLLVDFRDGSTLVESDLDLSAIQVFYLAQEAFDLGEASLGVTEDGSFSALNRRISNVLNPVNAQDVATKNYVDTGVTSQVVIATQKASEAAASAAAALNSQNAAAGSASTATTQANTATTKASEAAGSATNSANSAGTATTKAGEAATSASNAAASAATATQKAAEASASADRAALFDPSSYYTKTTSDDRYVNAAGDTMTGELALPSLYATNGTISIRGGGNRHLWYQTPTGTGRGLVYHENADGSMRMQVYNTSGAFVHGMKISEAGEWTWSGHKTTLNDDKSTGDVESIAWSSPTLGYRSYFGSDQRLHFQRTTNGGSVWATLLRFEATGTAWFDNNKVYAPHGVHTDTTSTHGLLPGNGDAANLTTQNLWLMSWWGIGLRCSMDNQTRIAFDTRDGRIIATNNLYLGPAGSEAVFQTDGNVVFRGGMATTLGVSLHGALTSRARINDQTSNTAVGFPIGVVIPVYTNGAALQRNGGVTPCLSTADTLYYRVQGAPSAGTALDGAWRVSAHLGSDWVIAQRIG